jgi:quinoprotein glucose dehydrogenase
MLVAVSLQPVVASDWLYYGGDAGGSRFSSADQINRDNVKKLKEVWSIRTGTLEQHADLGPAVSFHATPILLPETAGGHLVVCTPLNRIIALDPATGDERWRYDPNIDKDLDGASRFNCRGVTPWQDPEAVAEQACAWRLFMGTNDRRLISIDAQSGKACADFGDNGSVDINAHVKESGPRPDASKVQFTSPPAVIDGVVVLGSTNNAKFKDASAPSGVIRAFDARTGEMRWTFDTLIREPGGEHTATPEHVGGANAWTMLSMDFDLGMIYLPTGSASPDFYGGNRPGDNRYANSIVALNAATGELVWHQQLVHHDVWDYDLPAQPILVDIPRDGDTVPVLIQLTKMGMVFSFNRKTGEPFFAIEERPVPQNGMPDDQLSPTQPFPVRPPPLIKHGITPDDAWGFTFVDRNMCRQMIEDANYGDIYTPPSLQGTIVYPGPSGGSNWGGGAYDSSRNLLIAPVSQLGFYVRYVPVADVDESTQDDPMAAMPFGPPGIVQGIDYALEQKPFLSPFFSPCTPPPWAMLVAVDMQRGEIKWKVPLGVLDKLMPVPIPLKLGTPHAGGPIVTAGGLIFIGATIDERFRAYDIETGEQVWQAKLPTTANATPMTYVVDGRQFVVVAAGGHMFQYPQKTGDWLIAYALPEDLQN